MPTEPKLSPSHPRPKAEPPLEVVSHPSLTSDESHLHYLWGQIKILQKKETTLCQLLSSTRLKLTALRAEHRELTARRATKRCSIIEQASGRRTPSLDSLMKEVGASDLDDFVAILSRLVTALNPKKGD